MPVAGHGAGGDGGNLGLQACEIGQFVQRLAGDNGAVHIGDEQALAPPLALAQEGVDPGGADGGAHGLQRGIAANRNIGGLAGRENGGRATAHGIRHGGDQAGLQTCGGAVGDEGENLAHGRGGWQAERD